MIQVAFHQSRRWSKSGQQSKERIIVSPKKKLHFAITPDCRIIEGFLTGSNKADISFTDELSIAIYNCYITADKGYDSNKHQENLSSIVLPLSQEAIII